MFKRSLVIIGMVMISMLALVGCKKDKKEEPKETQPLMDVEDLNSYLEPEEDDVVYDYYLVAGANEVELKNVLFEKTVTIYVDSKSEPGKACKISFTDCTFEKGMVIVGERCAEVKILGDSEFKGNQGVTINSPEQPTVEEVSENDLISVYFGIENVDVNLNAPAVVSSDTSMTVNDKKYKMSDFAGCVTFSVICIHSGNNLYFDAIGYE